jgi:polyhydroxybutyrate depolymerase
MRTPSTSSLLVLALIAFAPACGSDNAAPSEEDSTGGGGDAQSEGGAATGGGTAAGGTRDAGAAGAVGSGGSKGTGGAANTGGSSGGDADVGASPGCGKAVSATGQQSGSVSVSGQTRTFLYVVPSGYVATQPIPVAFGFHGRGGDGQQGLSWGMHTAATGTGQKGLFIYPDGVDQGSSGTGWDEKQTGDDVTFFDAMLAWAGDNFCIDENRVFVAGFSWGCDFSNTLGCYRGDKIRAINCFSGGLYNSGCGTVTPAYRTTYSTPDGTDAYSQADFDKAVNRYKTALGCSDTTQATTPGPCLAYQGCSKPVIYCQYPNMGHSVPPNGGVHAWGFFASFP